MASSNGNGNNGVPSTTGTGTGKPTFTVKSGLAQMLKGGVIMDVVTPEQARVAEEAGAVAVMALERIPADIRVSGGVSRMSDPMMIRGIKEAVTIPVMAKARIGHFVEAQILQAAEVDYVDESEVLSMADEVQCVLPAPSFAPPLTRQPLASTEPLLGQPHQQEAVRRAVRLRVPEPG